MSPRLERVRVPDTFPRERVVLGELHLLRTRLDELLGEVATVIECSPQPDEAGWRSRRRRWRLLSWMRSSRPIWLDEHEIAATELSLLECEQYFDCLLEQGSVSTVRRQLADVRAAYRYGVRHGLVEPDPTVDVKLPRLPNIQPQTYSNQQLRAIHAAIRDEREEVAFYLFAFAGLRLGEVAGLGRERVDFERWQLRLTGKGGKFRLVPLHPALNDVLHEHRARTPRQEHVLARIDGRRLASNSLGRVVRTLVDRAGVDANLPSHAFRRTVATVMYEQGVRTRVIERIMGWSPRQMHERHYLRVADQPMHDAIQTLYREDPISERQQRTAPTGRALPTAEDTPAARLDGERTRLEALERRLGLRAG